MEERKVKIIEPTIISSDTVVRKRVCCYVRVSTGSEKQLESLQNQKEYYERLLRRYRGYIFCGVYSDAGISGNKKNRPEFMAMMQAARNGEIDIIYTKSVSRFARNTLLLLESVRELRELGVAVIFEEQGIDTLTVKGEFMLTILASIAQEERRSVSQNIQWSKRKQFENGEGDIGVYKLMGYDRDEEGNIFIVPEQAKIVRKVFKMYIDGMSTLEIANELNKRGIPAYTKKNRWTQCRVQRMLRNPSFVGDNVYQRSFTGLDGKQHKNRGELPKYIVRNAHPAIVSRKVWEQVQEIYDERTISRYPLTGKLRCPFCGDVLVHNRYKNLGDWVCRTAFYQGVNTCPGLRLPDEIADRVTAEMQPINEPLVVVEVDHEEGNRKRRAKKNFHFIPVSEYKR